MPRNIPEQAIKAMLSREEALFTQRNPTSKALSEDAARNWLKGVPMHWMVDWGTPFPLFIAKANGVDVTDADARTTRQTATLVASQLSHGHCAMP